MPKPRRVVKTLLNLTGFTPTQNSSILGTCDKCHMYRIIKRKPKDPYRGPYICKCGDVFFIPK